MQYRFHFPVVGTEYAFQRFRVRGTRAVWVIACGLDTGGLV